MVVPHQFVDLLAVLVVLDELDDRCRSQLLAVMLATEVKNALIGKGDVGVLAEENVMRAFSILKAIDMPGCLRPRHAAKIASRACSVTVLNKVVRKEPLVEKGGGDADGIDGCKKTPGYSCFMAWQ